MQQPPKINIKAQVGATLIEHLAAIARSEGALWDGHTSIYALHRVWLTTLLEFDTCVPAMHPSEDDLLFDMQETHDCRLIGRHGEAYLCTGKNGTKYVGIEQLWVKASSNRYRDAMLEVWGNEMRSASAELHEAAAKVLDNCITLVAAKALRKNIVDHDKNKLISRLTECRNAHLAAARDQPQPSLMADFDCTLNGDHVFSATALETVPDAWVWLFPVPANANQAFGAKVERHYSKLRSTTATRYISTGMIYKLLASSMPRLTGDSDAIVNCIRGQLGASAEALAQLESIEDFVRDNFKLEDT